VRRLLSSYAPEEHLGEELLAIVRRFDELQVGQTDLPRLAAAAAEMLADEVCVVDLLNDHFTGAKPDGEPVADRRILGYELIQAIDAQPANPGEALRCPIDGRTFGAAILEHGQGRLGVVWTSKPEAALGAADDLVLERFAQAASMAIQQLGRGPTPERPSNPTALETLLAGGLDESAVASAIRGTNLDGSLRYSVIALAIEPVEASVAVATAAVGRAMDRRAISWRPVTVMNTPFIVATGEFSECDLFDEAIDDAARTDWRLMVGVGDAASLQELDSSASQAREALVFRTSSKEGGVTSFASLGALHLLTQIPRFAIDNDRDVAAIARLTKGNSGVDDLSLLIAYCETASLRQTGELMFLHHSSVEYRVRRIEKTLGFVVTTPTGRFRALLAATIYRLRQMSQL